MPLFNLRKSLLLLALCLPIAVFAQHDHDEKDINGDEGDREAPSHGSDRKDDAPVFAGVWNIRFDHGGSAVLDLRDWDGFWTEKGRSKMPAVCQGKKLPLTVQLTHPDFGLSFTVFASTVDPKCPNISYRFNPVDATAKTLKATTRGNGPATMKLVRRQKPSALPMAPH
jgi:hypothetical protein